MDKALVVILFSQILLSLAGTTEAPTKDGRLTAEENQLLQESCGKFERVPSNFGQKSTGSDYAQRDEAPWVVAVSKVNEKENGTTEKTRSSCSGVLISLRHVLAARHCQGRNKLVPVKKFRFVFDNDCAGDTIWATGRKPNCSVEGAIIRKAVKAFTPKHRTIDHRTRDLIVFELDAPVPLMANLFPACLADILPKDNDVLKLFSFGNDTLQPSQSKFGSLQKIGVTIMTCPKDDRLKKDNFCLKNSDTHPTHGDSGGGFISTGENNRHSVVGVVSGTLDISNTRVQVETAVAPHLNWICEYAGICVETEVTQLSPEIYVFHA